LVQSCGPPDRPENLMRITWNIGLGMLVRPAAAMAARSRSEKTPARQTGSDGIAPRDNIGRHVPVIFYRATTSRDRDKNKDPLP